MSMGKRLRDIRTADHKTQEQFGELAGVRKLAQIKYEKDERQPDAAYLAALHKAGYDVTYIVTGFHASEIAHQRAHVDALNAAEPGIDVLLDKHHAIANEWIYEGLKAIHIEDDINLGHLEMIVRGLAQDQREDGIRCTTDAECQLIGNYRRADERGRKVILDTADALADREKDKK